jgi:hypothetical protein
MMYLVKTTEQNIHIDIGVECIIIFGLFLTPSVTGGATRKPRLQARIRGAIKHRQLLCREAPPCGRVASKSPDERSGKIILTRDVCDYIAER